MLHYLQLESNATQISFLCDIHPKEVYCLHIFKSLFWNNASFPSFYSSNKSAICKRQNTKWIIKTLTGKRPFLSCLWPPFQNKFLCQYFNMKMSLISMKMKVQMKNGLYEHLFSHRGKKQLGNGLLCFSTVTCIHIPIAL